MKKWRLNQTAATIVLKKIDADRDNSSMSDYEKASKFIAQALREDDRESTGSN